MKTNDEIRRENLVLAINRVRTAAKLAELTGTAAAYLSQIKSSTPDSKSGTPKTMGDDLARRIEDAIGESPGWMDKDHSGTDSTDQADKSRPGPRPAHVQWVGDDEAEILDAYRTTDEAGRERIRTAAKGVPRVLLMGVIHNKA